MRRGFRGKNKRAEAVLAGKLALILLVALILVVFFILKGLDWVAGEEGGFGVFSGLFVFWLSFAFAIVVISCVLHLCRGFGCFSGSSGFAYFLFVRCRFVYRASSHDGRALPFCRVGHSACATSWQIRDQADSLAVFLSV
ncbi:hypothetical protein [Porphyromonas gulae]|uniref:Uncharacterized protein n=1 Tax=Porphyromonas gulae TaxID=111105 RepID=A0A0A2FGJ7_9PORP|nr:hypothetical protein [Porphyromonas gulae]KGN87459.1 hypothetical protein HR08_01985 [Porphyromonas gulae]